MNDEKGTYGKRGEGISCDSNDNNYNSTVRLLESNNEVACNNTEISSSVVNKDERHWVYLWAMDAFSLYYW